MRHPNSNLYSNLDSVNSNLAVSHDEADNEKGDMMPMGMRGEMDDEKIVCKFAPVSQRTESITGKGLRDLQVG